MFNVLRLLSPFGTDRYKANCAGAPPMSPNPFSRYPFAKCIAAMGVCVGGKGCGTSSGCEASPISISTLKMAAQYQEMSEKNECICAKWAQTWPTAPTTVKTTAEAVCTICDRNSNIQSRPGSLTFLYAAGQGTSQNSQTPPWLNGAGLSASYPASTTVSISGKSGSTQSQQVSDGQTFTVQAPLGTFDDESEVRFGNGESFRFQTSCYLPLRSGDIYGPLKLIGGGKCIVAYGKDCVKIVSAMAPGVKGATSGDNLACREYHLSVAGTCAHASARVLVLVRPSKRQL